MEVVCPWGFLSSDNEIHATDARPSSSTKVVAARPKIKTFASLLSSPSDYGFCPDQLPSPTIRGDTICVSVDKDLYQQQVSSCKTNLIGRLLLRKGSQPLKLENLKLYLQNLWVPKSAWKIVPLVRGFYDIHFNDEDDMRRIWSGGTCTLPTGVFRLYQWQPKFNPYDPKIQTHSQIWIKIYGLSLEFWHPRILMSVARGIGLPLQIDQATRDKVFGYYARVLVEVDLSGPLPSSIMVELPDDGFMVDIVYEN